MSKLFNTSLAAIFLSVSFNTSLNAAPTISKEQWSAIEERYGDHEGTPLYSSDDGPSSSCFKLLERLSDGTVLQNDFANGRGRFSIEVDSLGDNAGISFNFEFGTRGLKLPEPSC